MFISNISRTLTKENEHAWKLWNTTVVEVTARIRDDCHTQTHSYRVKAINDKRRRQRDDGGAPAGRRHAAPLDSTSAISTVRVRPVAVECFRPAACLMECCKVYSVPTGRQASTFLFTALHGMQTRSSDETSVCPAVRLSVKHVHCDKTKERSIQTL